MQHNAQNDARRVLYALLSGAEGWGPAARSARLAQEAPEEEGGRVIRVSEEARELLATLWSPDGEVLRPILSSEANGAGGLASYALPMLFRAVRLGDDGVYWDDLFSQNPHQGLPRRRLEPQRREHEPRSISEILNRRGEMSGNLALHQQIDFLNEINGLLEYLPEELYKRIEVRKIEMDRELDAASKIDRRPSFVGEMFAYGERQAGEFLEGLPWSFSRQG